MASHVSVFRNGKWVPQYDSQFIMQNQNDLVVFWQLTKGTAYGSICDGIQSLRCRSTESSVKKKRQNTFDNDIKGKLDFFHAVKRVTTALSKKRPLFYPAIQDF